MICNKCGANNVEGTVFCANCGNKIEQINNSQNFQTFTQQQGVQPQTQQINSQPMQQQVVQPQTQVQNVQQPLQQPIQSSNPNMNATINNNDIKKNSKNKIIIPIILIIVIAVVIIILFLSKGGKNGTIGNMFNSSYKIKLIKSGKHTFKLGETNQELELSNSITNEFDKYNVYKVNDYITVFEDYYGINIKDYNNESNKDKTYNGLYWGNLKSGIVSSKDEQISIFDYDGDEEEYKKLLNSTKTMHEMALEFSKDEDELTYVSGTPTVKKISDKKSVVIMTESWNEVQYTYFMDIDRDNYFKITASCNPNTECIIDGEEFKTIIDTLDKLEFEIVEEE